MADYLFQIFYDEATRTAVHPAFLPLDNSSNERPDWREYWPMRRFLQSTSLDEGSLYGFFSPRFLQKAAVSADDVVAFVRANRDAYDAIGFSPYPDQHALFWNVFEQCDWSSPRMAGVSQRVIEAIGCKVDLSAIVMDSRSSIFCNYFCARPAFWREWLGLCERIFDIAETGAGSLTEALNTPMNWRPDQSGIAAPGFKVFVVERIASLVLALNPHFKSIAFEPFLRPRTATPLARFLPEMVMSDALKIAFAKYGDEGYRGGFNYIRQAIKKEVGDGRG